MKIVSIAKIDNYYRQPGSPLNIPENMGGFGLLPFLFTGGYAYEGYVIYFDYGIRIEMLVNNDQQCCESFGAFSFQDNLEDFIGAEFKSWKIITQDDEGFDSKEMLQTDYFEGEATFIQIETDKGQLEFTVYNSHNGYYGHIILAEMVRHDIAPIQ